MSLNSRSLSLFSLLLLIAAVVQTAGTSRVARASSGPVFNPANGHWYEAVSVFPAIFWGEARIAANERSVNGMQGHLATFTSADETAFIQNNLPESPNGEYLIGGFQVAGSDEPGGNWRWITGEPMSYTNWIGGEPNNVNIDDVMNHKASGGWNDHPQNVPHTGYLVEYGGPVEAPPLAYVADQNSDRIAVIDTATNTLVSGFPLADGPTGIAVASDNDRMYVTNAIANTVSAVELPSGRVRGTIATGPNPGQPAVSPNTTRVYVPNRDASTLTVINAVNNTVVTTITVGDSPQAAAASNDGKRVYVTNGNSDTVSVIDTATNTEITAIPVGDAPSALVIDPLGERVYVCNTDADTLSVIDTKTNTVVGTLPVGNAPVGIAIQPDGSRLFIANQASQSVQVVNAATGALLATHNVFRPLDSITYEPMSGSVYVSAPGNDSVTAVKISDGTKLTISAGDGPMHIGIPSVPVPPTMPDDASVVLLPSGQLRVTWSDNSLNEVNFEVRRSVNGGSFNLRATPPKNTTAYQEQAVPNTTYAFLVRSRNVLGNSAWASTNSLTTPNPPTAPTNLAASTPQPDKISLTWDDNSSDELSFYIERRFGAAVKTFSVPANSEAFVDTVSDRSNSYTYRVRATAPIGPSAWSNTVTVDPLPAPAAPSDATAVTENFNRVRVSWLDNSSNESRFLIYRQTGAGAFVKIASVGADVTSYVNAPVVAGDYTYRVIASNLGGVSAPSNDAPVTMPSPPDAPSAVNAERINATVRVTWRDNSNNENSFSVERKINEGSWIFYGSVAANTTSLIDAKINTGNQYSYRVRASNTGGYSAYSDPASITIF